MSAISPLKMQPSFKLDVPLSADQAIEKIRSALAKSSDYGPVAVAGRVLDLKIAPSECRFWSPHLSVQLSDTDRGAELFGRFSPRPEIWTMVIAIYAVVIFLMLPATMFGCVQWSLGFSPWAFILIPIGLGIIVMIHTASVVGQRLSSDQMESLRQRLDQILEAASVGIGAGEKPVAGVPES